MGKYGGNFPALQIDQEIIQLFAAWVTQLRNQFLCNNASCNDKELRESFIMGLTVSFT